MVFGMMMDHLLFFYLGKQTDNHMHLRDIVCPPVPLIRQKKLLFRAVIVCKYRCGDCGGVLTYFYNNKAFFGKRKSSLFLPSRLDCLKSQLNVYFIAFEEGCAQANCFVVIVWYIYAMLRMCGGVEWISRC